MRTITKDIQLTIDGSLQGLSLTKPDAFSGVEILCLLLRLQDEVSCHPEPQVKGLSVLDLIISLSGDQLRPIRTGVLNELVLQEDADRNGLKNGMDKADEVATFLLER